MPRLAPPFRRRLATRLTLTPLGLAAATLGLPLRTAHAQPGSFAGPVPVERLIARREALAAHMGTGIAIIPAGPTRDEDGRDHPQDNFYRQSNDFFYLTGLETPESWLVLVARDSALVDAILYIPARDTLRERWWGPQITPGPEAQALTGIRDIRSNAVAEQEVPRLVRSGASPARRGALFTPRTPDVYSTPTLRELNETPGLRLEDVSRPLALMRLVKDADEIARIRRATDLSIEGHLAAWRVARPGAWDRELEAAAEGTWRALGAERNAYPSIVASGPRSVFLHLTNNRGRLGDGDVVVMDMAAEHGYFKSDVTRTIPANGRFAPRQRAIYDLVLGAQQAAIDSVRPGITIGRLNAIAHEYFRAHSGTLCGPESCERFFVHGLSHWLGMDTHDVGPYNVPLQAGMVFTVEPGLTLASEGFRIGIEDVVLVTDTGAENLSARLPRSADAIEAYMRTHHPR